MHNITRKKPARAKITKRSVDAMQPGDIIADSEVRGFVVRCLPSGTRTYGYRYVNVAGAQRWLPLGLHGKVTPDKGRTLAKKAAGNVAEGKDPVAEREGARAKAAAEKRDLVKNICEEWLVREGGMTRNADGKSTFSGKLRSAEERMRTFERLVYPQIGAKLIEDVSRTDIVRMLDKIEDDNGVCMADHVLAFVRKVMNWHASRSDTFRSPIVPGMARSRPKERERERVLDDAEIAAVWAATAKGATFDRLVRFLLLTGARRSEAAEMPWSELSDQPATAMAERWQTYWSLPAARNKTKQDLLRPLSATAEAILPQRKGEYVFSTDDGTKFISSFSKKTAALQKKSGTAGWTLHDLRRTARTLLSRAGVPADIAERCLGHKIGGVRGVYDRHQYTREMLDAYEKLAALLDRIIKPPAANVVEMRVRTAV